MNSRKEGGREREIDFEGDENLSFSSSVSAVKCELVKYLFLYMCQNLNSVTGD